MTGPPAAVVALVFADPAEAAAFAAAAGAREITYAGSIPIASVAQVILSGEVVPARRPDDSSLDAWLAAAVESLPLDEALAGIKRIAEAAGIFEQTWQAGSIGGVCDMIAEWCRTRRREEPARAPWDDPQVMRADLDQAIRDIEASGGPGRLGDGPGASDA